LIQFRFGGIWDLRFRIGARAKGGQIFCAEIAPIGENGRKNRSWLARAKVQKTVACPARKSVSHALCKAGIEWRSVIRFH
jgi:hypothetical protein